MQRFLWNFGKSIGFWAKDLLNRDNSRLDASIEKLIYAKALSKLKWPRFCWLKQIMNIHDAYWISIMHLWLVSTQINREPTLLCLLRIWKFKFCFNRKNFIAWRKHLFCHSPIHSFICCRTAYLRKSYSRPQKCTSTHHHFVRSSYAVRSPIIRLLWEQLQFCWCYQTFWEAFRFNTHNEVIIQNPLIYCWI